MHKSARKFTIFTPTFNRGKTLSNVYASLKNQTYKDFHWVIVDDGSSDDTHKMVNDWINESIIEIQYIFQKNSGKHIAINKGVDNAKGEFFVIFDSDDTCEDIALERFLYHWESIKEDERNLYSTVVFLCTDLKGNLIGGEFPKASIDSKTQWERIRIGGGADRWGFIKTSILKKYRFPQYKNEIFLSEGIVWNRMAKDYRVRFINEKLKIVEYRDDGLSRSSIKLRSKNPNGAVAYYEELSNIKMPLYYRIKTLINLNRFKFHSGRTKKIYNNLLANKILNIILMPIGYLFYINDLKKK